MQNEEPGDVHEQSGMGQISSKTYICPLNYLLREPISNVNYTTKHLEKVSFCPTVLLKSD